MNSSKDIGRLSQTAAKRSWARGCSAATWLIVPVVICLSQRLSHAGLSTGRSNGIASR